MPAGAKTQLPAATTGPTHMFMLRTRAHRALQFHAPSEAKPRVGSFFRELAESHRNIVAILRKRGRPLGESLFYG